jgi:predicted aspartyl protease
LASTKFDDHSFLEITVHHRRLRALLDTGAAHSCVANSVLKQLGVRYKALNKDAQVSLIDANGKPLGVISTVELPIGVGDVTLTHTFYVVRGLYLKALLVFDFLRENAIKGAHAPRTRGA